MGFTRAKTVWLICVLALAVLSLRPDDYASRFLDVVFTPTRVLAALSSPLRVLDPPSVLAADEEQVEAERALCRAVRTAFRESARPRDEVLAARAVVIEAEVLQRTVGDRDELLVRVPTSEGIAPGVPAVCGDAYVGRVVAQDPEDPKQVRVQLLTDSEFRVGGAALEDGRRSDLIVGGLAPLHDLTRGALRLAVHNPSDRGVRAGTVRVAEPEALALDDEDSRLADGFLLGELRELEYRHKEVVVVQPALEFEAGLFHVALLVPRERAPREVPPLEDLFDASAWSAGELLLAGELSSWRAGRKLALEDGGHVVQGSAVTLGARFVGRVERVGTTLADVRLLDDPGLAVPALALVRGDVDELVVLGSLVSLGRAEDGRIRLRWRTDRPLGATQAFGRGELEAELFTGSGQRGVPLGLLLGKAVLPTRAGTHEVLLESPRIGSDRVDVRRVREEGKKP